MIRGLYGATSAMMAAMVKQDVIANNLANVNTTGFKADMAVFKALENQHLSRLNDRPDGLSMLPQDWPVPIGQMGMGAKSDGVYVDYTDGTFRETQNPLDVALVGEGFFAVDTGRGIRYTRDGAFTLNDGGELVTSQGHKVLGSNGPIVLADADISINERGEILAGGAYVDQIQVVSFDKPFPLTKIGANLYQAPDDAPVIASDALVKQGGIETSNVSSVEEMVHMIATMRAYEAAAKALQGEDELLGKAVNDVGRVQG